MSESPEEKDKRRGMAMLAYVQRQLDERGLNAVDLGSVLDWALFQKAWPPQDHSERITTWNEAVQACRQVLREVLAATQSAGSADALKAPAPPRQVTHICPACSMEADPNVAGYMPLPEHTCEKSPAPEAELEEAHRDGERYAEMAGRFQDLLEAFDKAADFTIKAIRNGDALEPCDDMLVSASNAYRDLIDSATLKAQPATGLAEALETIKQESEEAYDGSGEPPDVRQFDDKALNNFVIDNGSDGETYARLYWHAKAALSNAAPAGWRPIAEAPKDGTRILVAHNHFGWVHEVSWRRPDDCDQTCEDECCAAQWLCWGSGSVSGCEPTHFMPLPLPPTQETETPPQASNEGDKP